MSDSSNSSLSDSGLDSSGSEQLEIEERRISSGDGKKKKCPLVVIIVFGAVLLALILLIVSAGLAVGLVLAFSSDPNVPTTPSDDPWFIPDGFFGAEGFVMDEAVSSSRRTIAGVLEISQVAPKLRGADYVLAANPVHGGLGNEDWFALAPVDDNGRFRLELKKQYPWVLIFVNSSAVGEEMILGLLRAKNLHCLFPTTDSEKQAHLGNLNNSLDHDWVDVAGDNDIYEALGIPDFEANRFGVIDSFMIRYSNPDLDGNGLVDYLEDDFPDVDIDVNIDFNIGNTSVNFVETHIKNAKYPLTEIPFEFAGATINFRISPGYVNPVPSWWPSGFPERYRVSWNDENGGAMQGICDSILHAPGITWGEQCAGNIATQLTDLGVSHPFDDWGVVFEVMFWPNLVKNLPRGRLQFEIFQNVGPNITLTFPHVLLPEDVSQAEGLLIPVVTFRTENVTEPDLITHIDYEWMEFRPAQRDLVPTSKKMLELFVGSQMTRIMWTEYCHETHGEIALNAYLRPSEVGFETTGMVEASAFEGDVAETRLSKLKRVNYWVTSTTGLTYSMGLGPPYGTCT